MMLLLSLTSAFAEEEVPGFTLAEMWATAAIPAKVVIVMLVLMMVASVIIFIERMLAFGSATSQSKQLAARIVPHLNKNDVNSALKLAKDDAFKASYLAGILKAGLAELDLRQDEHGVHNAERAVVKAAGQEIAKLKRWMSVLATVGSTAPFVGLFGTTVGVINAFRGMATAGAGLAGISAGISEALITTAAGIAVAVFGVWMFNYFNNRVDKVTEELNSSEADFMGWAEKLIQGRPGAEAAK